MWSDICWAIGCLIGHINFGLAWDYSLYFLLGSWALLLLTLRKPLTAGTEGRGIYIQVITYFILLIILSGLVLYSFASGWLSHIAADVNALGF